MENNKNYKIRRISILILVAVFIGSITHYFNSKKEKKEAIENKQKLQIEKQIEEKDKKIQQLEKSLETANKRNIQSNFLNKELKKPFEGEYKLSSTDEEYSFRLEFKEDLKASLRIKGKYEVNGEEIVKKIAYPLQQMKISETDAEQGYIFLEGLKIIPGQAYDKEGKLIENIEFSISQENELDTFDIKIWIDKDNKITGFLFDKDGTEFARLSGEVAK